MLRSIFEPTFCYCLCLGVEEYEPLTGRDPLTLKLLRR